MQIKMNLERELECLEDHDLNTKLSRSAQYRNVLNILLENGNISSTCLERLLAVCVHDLQDDVTFAVNALSVLTVVLKKIKTEDIKFTHLLPSALKILNCINATLSSSTTTVDSFISLCVETLLLYPDEVLINLVTTQPDATCHMYNNFSDNKISIETRMLKPLSFLSKLLTILPAEIKLKYVKDGLNIWFLKVIPAIMTYYVSKSLQSLVPIEALEKLTDELVPIDYSDDQSWKLTFECILNPKKYPVSMKSLLEHGSNVWHRLWMVFIRLLKNLITKTNKCSGSPINSMLPVVETAFKMDVDNRCRAFQCWNVLIDNFSTEINEEYIVKRIKLLIIPLKSNNAKVEETALAKLNTWWYLITKFEKRLDMFLDTILIPYLHFCFGKDNPPQGKVVVVPGLLSDNIKRKCIETLVELVGHSRICHGCVSMPKLEKKVLSTHLLVNHWNDWRYACQVAVTMSGDIYNDSTTAQVTCLWKSLVSTLSDLPDNNVRKDLFNDIVSMIDHLVMICNTNKHLRNIVYDALIQPLIEIRKFRTLLLSREANTTCYLVKIVCLLTSDVFDDNPKREHLNKIFKLVMDAALDVNFGSPNYEVQGILKNLPANDKTLIFWTVMAKSMSESKFDFWPHNYINMLKWPLKFIKSFTNVMVASVPWYEIYPFVYMKLNSILYREISETLYVDEIPSSGASLLMSASLAVLKHELIHKPEKQCNKEVEFLLKVLNSIELETNLDKMYPILIDTLSLTLSKCKNSKTKLSENTEFSQSAIMCAKCVVKSMCQKPNSANNMVFIGKIKKELIDLSLLQKYANLKPLIQEALAECSALVKNNNKETPTEIKNNSKTNCLNTPDKKIPQPVEPKSTFSTPEITCIKKPVSSKKKEANIVNTVENGEEFLVVKSNWKFNPKKLTENQKEKLQRKREIPALYQDLSQSQDEFKLSTWKTDSQDTSLSSKSNSKTTDNNDVSVILNKLPSVEILPNIMGNILSENAKKEDKLVTDIVNKNTITSNVSVIVEKLPSLETMKHFSNMNTNENNKEPDKMTTVSPKSTPTPAKNSPKTPRIPLKDRVHRNVKMLIEKNKSEKDIPENLNQTVNVDLSKTPQASKKHLVENLVNSAPPMLSADRPSRLKRKPKKFHDSELFPLKRKRNSSSLNSQPESDNSESSVPQTNEVTVNIEDLNKIQGNGVIQVINPINSNKLESIENKHEGFHDIKEDGKENQVVVDNENAQENINCDNVRINDNPYISTNDENKSKEKSESISTKTNLHDNVNEINSELKPLNQSHIKPKQTPKTTPKKCGVRKSRIEKELAIDMVEGHPFLQVQSQKRTRRKNLTDTTTITPKSKSVVEKINKNKLTEKVTKKLKDKTKEADSQELLDNSSRMDSSTSLDKQQFSEDVIESSQDSSITTISMKSTRAATKKMPDNGLKRSDVPSETQSLLGKTDLICDISLSQANKDDSVLPLNNTMPGHNVLDLTENLDTETMDNSEVIFVKSDTEPPIVIATDTSTSISPETQEIAEADTETMDPKVFLKKSADDSSFVNLDITIDNQKNEPDKSTDNVHSKTANDTTIIDDAAIVITTIAESLDVEMSNQDTGECSPYKDDNQRKKDFLNNTLEISPIKTLSPVRQRKSPSPETSSDYVVIQLSSPVQSNGEPFEKCDSPEVFTEDKVSPDKRDQSPPRVENNVTITSPSSSLSLKKNRPQVRSGGRAAQMLGLCGANDKLQSTMAVEEPKRNNPVTPARRNLKIMYITGDNDQDDNEQSENFLKFKKVLPTVDCSPSGPILKRKLVDIVDEATISPASKRKRVSFHDPPVSTTISVHKYIEPISLRSPQNSAQKRFERQTRAQTCTKSPKRLENVFKLDTVLHKTIESFTENDTINSTEDTQMSLDETPAVEVIRTSDLNDIDPICQELIECKDPLDNIATELSSPTMKALLIKELVGKVETVGDLARMTELEVNRLCIKAPKVQVAKKVLADYAKRTAMSNETAIEMQANIDLSSKDMESQTVDVATSDVGMQFDIPVSMVTTQTETAVLADSSSQTMESGSKSTEDIVKSTMSERKDFIENLCNVLDDTSKEKVADTLPLDVISSMMINKITPQEGSSHLNQIVRNHDRFDRNNLILFCSQLLQKIHDNTKL